MFNKEKNMSVTVISFVEKLHNFVVFQLRYEQTKSKLKIHQKISHWVQYIPLFKKLSEKELNLYAKEMEDYFVANGKRDAWIDFSFEICEGKYSECCLLDISEILEKYMLEYKQQEQYTNYQKQHFIGVS